MVGSMQDYQYDDLELPSLPPPTDAQQAQILYEYLILVPGNQVPADDQAAKLRRD